MGSNMSLSRDKLFALLTLLPSLVLISIFVYGFIGHTFYISLTDWGGAAAYVEGGGFNFIGLKNYRELFTGFLDYRFRQDLVNTFFYLVFVTLGSLGLGLFFAILLDRAPRGEGFFKTLFLYPMSLSFIVTGTIWRWLLTDHGINTLPLFVGLSPLNFNWVSSYGQILQFNWQNLPKMTALLVTAILTIIAIRTWLQGHWKRGFFMVIPVVLLIAWIFWDDAFIPKALPFAETHGFNLATVGIIIVAVWQYSGYTMALYLAGLRGIGEDLHEAAKLDGCNEFQFYTRVAIPLLKPLTFSAIIILAHISLKMFDLIFALAGPDNAGTSHLSLLMYLKTFRGNQLGKGAAISVVLFIMIALFVISYLIRSYWKGKA